MASPDKTPPVFVDGIGPPLSQIAEDYEGERTTAARDVLALLAEVVRLREALQEVERFLWEWPINGAGYENDQEAAEAMADLRVRLLKVLGVPVVASPDKPPPQ